ncbi:peptide-methionine (S)-S-oxide reductase MsrA [Pelomonas sp. Root1237]|uniref:peptide-methionine (S)-S-oxide reductase MsrA n=1 Tax=Pelomonas sp. Root1237 TaxID=1736434 RepID=UPI0006F2137F|nr:peptide-methionine (S)-S-oxide reductase MsrA [Pelomonas sp. Root1237]KQV86403.1 methionine sulfoxide reductase A [Pelomonas sp. Root1237]
MTSLPSRRRFTAALLLGSLAGGCAAAGESVSIPPPAQDLAPTATGLQTAVFAGGCFWGVQGVFQHVQGVQQAVSGYAGGTASTANYKLVTSGRTGHAEAVEVTFDPSQVSYGALLQVFFSVAHNPTQLNHQGPDIGRQYRSALFPADAAQRETAQAYIAQLDATGLYGKPIVTKVENRGNFYPAEKFHQDYLVDNPRDPYIVFHDLPKIAALKRLFGERFRSEPMLVKQAR